MPLTIVEYKDLMLRTVEKISRASGDVKPFVFHDGATTVQAGAAASTLGYRWLTFQVSGLVAATLQVEATIDEDAWHPLSIISTADGSETPDIQANGLYRVNVRGIAKVRIPVRVYTGGTIVVTGNLQA